MRIFHVSTERGWGGGEQQAALLVAGLAQRGHDVRILARAGGQFARRIAAAGFAVIEIAGSARSPRALWQMRRALVAEPPEVVHFHDAHALTGAGLACLGLRVPARIAARKVNYSLRQPWRYRWLADRILCVSQAVVDRCHAAGIPADRLRLVPDGVDPARAASGDRDRGRQSLGLNADDELLLAIGSLTEIKGHRFLIAAMRELGRLHPRARLAIAGDGELRPELDRQVAALGLENRVQLLGYRSDIPDLLQASDVFVLPSLEEGMCSTLVDAMLAGRPIVASAVGGVPEVVGHEASPADACGTLVPPANPLALAAAIGQALANRSGLANQVVRARERALARFTADRMVEATLAAYHEQLNAYRAKSS